MIPEEEYREAKWQLENFPKTITGQARSRKRQLLKHKIKEYEYSTTFPLFESMPHIPYFINHKTTEPTLQQLIQATIATIEFTMDTESINIYKQNNQPALIQLQILLPYNLSLVILVEMHHLPNKHDPRFKLIQNIFKMLFSKDKRIFMWGSKNELDPFTTFDLFKQEQIDNTNIINLQLKFKNYWIQQHPHQKKSDEISNGGCSCERCLGKEASHTWSLQDAIIHEFKEYLPKESTCGSFNIGLDYKLFTMNLDQLSYREKLTKYAINDCIAMQRIIMRMKQTNFNLNFKINNLFDTMDLIPISDDDDNDLFDAQPNSSPIKLSSKSTNKINFKNTLNAPSIEVPKNNYTLTEEDDELIMTHPPEHVPSVGLIGYPHDWESMMTNANIDDEQAQPQIHIQPELSEEERKRIHNRSRTLKQRTRYYRNEIIYRNIDRRFTIRKIKTILRQHGILFSAVNKSKSGSTLYIGIKQVNKMDEYERITQHLFTTSHYRTLHHQHHHRHKH